MAGYVEPYPHERRIGERRRDFGVRAATVEGIRVSWGGIWGGVLVAIGLLLLLSVLGIAIGVSAVDPGEAEADALGTGVGVWGGLSLLVALFVGGLVATRIGAIYDRTTGFFEGALVWAVSVLLMIYLATTGVAMLTGGAFNMVRGVGSAVGMVAENGASSGEAKPQAPSAGALEGKVEEVQPVLTRGAWASFGALLLSLAAAVLGAMAGRRKGLPRVTPTEPV